jgi:hypothetical protein
VPSHAGRRRSPGCRRFAKQNDRKPNPFLSAINSRTYDKAVENKNVTTAASKNLPEDAIFSLTDKEGHLRVEFGEFARQPPFASALARLVQRVQEVGRV